jgi:hypothetical protein
VWLKAGKAVSNATDSLSVSPDCKAEYIFYARTRGSDPRPVKVLDEFTCDCRRPDWEYRWAEWNSQNNPYLNLFLCSEHAKKLGLIE